MSTDTGTFYTGDFIEEDMIGWTSTLAVFKDSATIGITLNADTIVVVKTVVANADSIVFDAFVEAGIFNTVTLIVDKRVNELIFNIA